MKKILKITCAAIFMATATTAAAKERNTVPQQICAATHATLDQMLRLEVIDEIWHTYLIDVLSDRGLDSFAKYFTLTSSANVSVQEGQINIEMYAEDDHMVHITIDRANCTLVTVTSQE